MQTSELLASFGSHAVNINVNKLLLTALFQFILETTIDTRNEENTDNISSVISTSKVSLVHSSYVLVVYLMIFLKPRHSMRHTCLSNNGLNAFHYANA